MKIGSDSSDEESLRFAEAWIDALAAGDYVGAFSLTEHDPYYQWTPELIRSVVEGYGLPEPHPSGEKYAVTDRQFALGGPPTRVVKRMLSKVEVRYDLPLNGRWSDLTVTFSIENRNNTSLVFILEEIHVF
jgi:hypothetical protein